MRTWLSCILVLLTGILGAASPAFGTPAKCAQPVISTIARTPAVEQPGCGQRYGQLGNAEAITADFSQPTAYGQVAPVLTNKFRASLYPATAIDFANGCDNARIQPFHRLILFPFHGFW